MKENIKKILQELYEIDKTLKPKEEELINIIEKMMFVKPNIVINKDFKEELKKQIDENILQLKLNTFKKWQSKNTFKKIWYFFLGIITTAFWIFIFNTTIAPNNQLINNYWISTTSTSNNSKSINSISNFDNLLSFNSTINEDDIWFWNLKSLWNNKSSKWLMVKELWMSQMAFWNDNLKVSDNNDIEIENITSWRKMLISPDYITEVFRYNYFWSLDLNLPSKLPVYKKINSNKSWKIFANNIKNFSFNWINISEFSNLWVSNITFNQDEDYGYTLNLDFDNQSLNLYQNWEKWPQRDYNKDKKQVILKENELYKIANDFLQKYHIDIKKYAFPIIEKKYLENLKNYENNKLSWDFLQSNVTINYPLIIDGNLIKQEQWENTWLNLTINLEEKKVSSLYWLKLFDYLKSDYEIETNTKNILKIANVWGKNWLDNLPNLNDEIKYTTINLKNPKLQYIVIYDYKDNKDDQYLVPAIVFEIDKENNNSFQDNISVPLLKDLYNYTNWEIDLIK